MAHVYRLVAKCENCGQIVESPQFPSLGVQRAFDPEDWLDVECLRCGQKFKAKFGQLIELPKQYPG